MSIFRIGFPAGLQIAVTSFSNVFVQSYIHVKDARKADGVIVPAGKGDGKIQEILKDLFEHGYKGFISLEPHLTELDGLKNLERDGESLKGMQQMDGAEAFTVACEALRKILKNLGQDI